MIHIITTNTKSAAQIHSHQLTPTLKERIKSSSLTKDVKIYLDDNLEDVLTGTPTRLVEVHEEFKALIDRRDKKRVVKGIKAIFKYDLFIEKKVGYNAYNLAENLGMNVCPYCNREHTITINNKEVKGQLTRPDFDHYLPKSQYPLFALSFYNLIPSCKICNSTFKGKKNVKLKTHLHPYVDSILSHVKFDYKETVNAAGEKDIEIIIKPIKDCKDKIRIAKSLELFKIEKVYNGHKYIVKDLLDKKDEANGDYLEILANHTYKNLKTSKERLYYFAFGTYQDEKDFYKRPFSKLVYDILDKEKMLESLTKTEDY
ncbi:HNH endonuclease [Pontibacter sp. HSC-36F09]|uniref:HNH endonuclease n=1 Tax=Pontibacter sp. HSC-36F09 TaxID=2910966 RepID=UPI00209FF2BE|nr:hypothetical protein [Pontibacter sp. HSC-36F09]MCP2044706.1 hypothetical protein [Pontibacter sp. HSC-36F09]